MKIKQYLKIFFKLLTILLLIFLFSFVVLMPSLKNILEVQNIKFISYFFVDSIQILIFGIVNLIIYLGIFKAQGIRNSQSILSLIFIAVHLILLIFTFAIFGTREYSVNNQVTPLSSADFLLISTFKFLLITLLITYFSHFYLVISSWLKSCKELIKK